MKQFQYTKHIKHTGIKLNSLLYGVWGIQTLEYGFISEKHIKYIKQYIQKFLKKGVHFKINSNMNTIFTKKPIETRMGGGKGAIYERKYFVQPGSIFLEIYNLPFVTLISFLKIINSKISLKLRLIKFK